MAAINGTANDDILAGTAGDDIILGLAGNDELSDVAGKDKLDGGAGNDTLDGGADNDTLIGGDHDDILFGGIGNDAMTGGKGNDVYYVDSVADKVSEAPNQGHDTVVSTVASFTLGANVEDLVLALGAINGIGNTLNNVIAGNDAGNQLQGGGGNDELSGDDSADILEGGAGSDTLDGGPGADNMRGGAGNDVYVVDNPLDLVTELAGGGTDLVKATVDGLVLGANVENLTLLGAGNLAGTGNTLNNVLTGNGGNNLLVGDKGNDTLEGGLGGDTLKGGLGNDVYFVDSDKDVVVENIGEGKDTVHSTVNFEIQNDQEIETLIVSSAGSIEGRGNTFANTVTMAGTGKAYLTGSSGNDTLTGGVNDDELAGGDENDLLNGGDGNDTLNGGDENDKLNGGNGDDHLDARSGDDIAAGGKGNDSYEVSDSKDKVVELANQGYDTVGSRATSYTLAANVEALVMLVTGLNGTGNAQNNDLTGNALANKLDGAGGRDEIFGGGENDTLIGGVGNDTYVVDDPNDVVREAAGKGNDTVRSTVDYKLEEGEEIETLILSSGGFILGYGNSGNNLITVTGGYGNLRGEGGNDTITGAAGGDDILGGSGNDKLVGGDGNDEIDGGTGKDVMIGGKGDDEYVVDDVGDKITELAKQGDDWVGSSLANYTLGANLENLGLDDGGLNGTGNALNNTIFGNDLGNVLNGAGGRDELFGNDGNDTLKGGAGFDILEGNSGADVLYGEADAADVFRYQISSAGELAALGGDTINSFRSLQDKIELTDLVADFGINPDLAFTGGYVYLIDNGANTDLLFDKDGAIGAGVPLVLATIVNANILQIDVVVEGFFNT